MRRRNPADGRLVYTATKRRALKALVTCAVVVAPAAAELPPTDVAYRIEARLDPETRELRGRQTLTWLNRADRPVETVPVHLYLNAFSHQGTTWMREYYGTREPGWLERYDDPWGFIEPVSVVALTSDGTPVEAPWEPIRPDDGNPLDRSLIEIRLPMAVAPGARLTLQIEFEARLPHTIARTGCVRDFCMVAQWFPKLGVLELPGTRGADEPRWAARQFHGDSEFYADFADYDVTLDLPEGWRVGATGRRVEERAGEPGRRSVRYRQRAVHDFAFAVGRRLADETHAHDPDGAGGTVEVRYLMPQIAAELIPRVRRVTEGSLDVMGRRVGPYPYDTLTVIYVPLEAAGAGGMEYPTLFTGIAGDPLFARPPFDRLPGLIDVAAHEFAHQYFYGVVASNEQEEAFLDEGLTSFWEVEILREVYGEDFDGFALFGYRFDPLMVHSLGAESGLDNVREALSKSPTSLFYPGTWPVQAYSRPALTFDTATSLFGRDLVDAVFAAYYECYGFRHPAGEDFLRVARDVGGDALADFLHEAFTQPRIPDYSVAEISSRSLTVPLGRVVTDAGPVSITAENRDEQRETIEAALSVASAGMVRLEVTDPGWTRFDRRQAGAVRWIELQPVVAAAVDDAAEENEPSRLHESFVRLEGPGWEHLPVEVSLRFDDGSEVRDLWDGRARWRTYRTWRPSRLIEVRLDPDVELTLDPRPQNNGRRLEPDERLQSDWGLWLGALAQWIAGAFTLWL